MEAMDFMIDTLVNPKFVEERPGGEIYISSASAEYKDKWGVPQVEGSCLRQQWYRMNKFERSPRKINNYLQTELGDVFSEYLADLAKRAGIYIAHEARMTKSLGSYNLRGRADLLVGLPTLSGNVERVGIEIKSIRDGYYSRKNLIDRDKTEDYMPRMSHALQSAIYHDYYRHKGFTHWQILYIDRSQGDWSSPSHKVVVTDEGKISVNGKFLPVTMDQVYERFERLLGYYEANEVPPRDYELEYSKDFLDHLAQTKQLTKTEMADYKKGKLVKGDFACNYCDFKKTCWKLND